MPISEKAKKNQEKIGYFPTEIEADAINVIGQFITQTENLQSWVTPEIAFNMREVLKRCRRNYLGIFEEGATDDQGNERIWSQITQSFVESEIKNTDVDPKDVSIEADVPEAIGLASVLRPIIRQWMKDTEFGQAMDDDLRDRAIDGHVIRKVYEGYPVGMKKAMVMTRSVDLLKVFIDGNAESLHTSPFAEMATLSVPDIKRGYSSGAGKWMNLKFLGKDFKKGSVDLYTGKTFTSTVPQADIVEYHSDIPEWWVTGDKEKWVKDGMPYKLGMVIISNIFDAPIVHKIIFNTKGIKPYEEGRLIKVKNRYLGMGRAEQLFGLQLYINLLNDARRVNHLLSKNQLFYFRTGRGITAQQVANLVTGGSIGVQEAGDVGRIDTRDLAFGDLLAEERAQVDSAQRLTDQNDVALGGTLPTSTPATIGVLQERSQGRGSELKRESFGRYLENLFNRHLLKGITENLTEGDVIKFTESTEKVKKFDEAIINYFVNQQLIGVYESGGLVPDEEIEAEKQRLRTAMQGMGQQRWIQLVKAYLGSDKCKVSVNISNEHEDKATVVKTLENILINLGRTNPNIDPDSILQTIMDKLGLDPEVIIKSKSKMDMMQGQQMGQIPNAMTQPVGAEDSLLSQTNQMTQ